MDSLAYLGMIVDLDAIENADNLELATANCKAGGKWKSVVRKGDFKIGDRCNVYLPDSILPNKEEFNFMADRGHRVRQIRLRGCPSECLIMPYEYGVNVGDDITADAGVTKYEKLLPTQMAGVAKGSFPSFLQRTDEENFQKVPHIVEYLVGRKYYATEKADGTSCTVFFNGDRFGVCSRSLELRDSEGSTYWDVAKRYNLQEKLPKMGEYAIQFEICGPGIQSNPMGLRQKEARVFDVFDIRERRYMGWRDIEKFCADISIPTVRLYSYGYAFAMNHDDLQKWVEDKVYECNGKPVEGAVFRTIEPEYCGQKRVSFKVVNLKYKG